LHAALPIPRSSTPTRPQAAPHPPTRSVRPPAPRSSTPTRPQAAPHPVAPPCSTPTTRPSPAAPRKPTTRRVVASTSCSAASRRGGPTFPKNARSSATRPSARPRRNAPSRRPRNKSRPNTRPSGVPRSRLHSPNPKHTRTVSGPLSRPTPISPRPAHTRPSHLRARNRLRGRNHPHPARNRIRGRNHPHPAINTPPQDLPPARTPAAFRPHSSPPPDLSRATAPPLPHPLRVVTRPPGTTAAHHLPAASALPRALTDTIHRATPATRWGLVDPHRPGSQANLVVSHPTWVAPVDLHRPVAPNNHRGAPTAPTTPVADPTSSTIPAPSSPTSHGRRGAAAVVGARRSP